ncbi:MAG: response regulator [Pyrinomonadaceae bacterium]
MTKKTILVADDSPAELRLVVDSLEREGYTVITAIDGEQALAVASASNPSLVILDIIMPKKNGYQVLRQLRTTPATKQMKVMLISSKNHESDRFWGLKQGADAYIGKPFQDDELLRAVGELTS